MIAFSLNLINESFILLIYMKQTDPSILIIQAQAHQYMLIHNKKKPRYKVEVKNLFQ
jgi:hypothetical protein